MSLLSRSVRLFSHSELEESGLDEHIAIIRNRVIEGVSVGCSDFLLMSCAFATISSQSK